MTTLQLAQRLMRNLTLNSVDDLPADEAARLVDAMNTGLNEFIRTLPDHRMTTAAAYRLHAPVTHSIEVLEGAKGFSYVAGSLLPAGGYESEQDALGHTVMVEGDAHLNAIHSSGELLSPYWGSSGTRTMTLYGDCAQLGETDIRIVSAVYFVRQADQFRQKLILRNQPQRPPSFESGDPIECWTVSHAGQRSTARPLWLLKVWPLPLTAGEVQFDMLAFPEFIEFDDLHTPRVISTTVAEESLLTALAMPGLFNSPFWAATADRQIETGAYERARQALAAMNTPQTAAPTRTTTAPGW